MKKRQCPHCIGDPLFCGCPGEPFPVFEPTLSNIIMTSEWQAARFGYEPCERIVRLNSFFRDLIKKGYVYECEAREAGEIWPDSF